MALIRSFNTNMNDGGSSPRNNKKPSYDAFAEARERLRKKQEEERKKREEEARKRQEETNNRMKTAPDYGAVQDGKIVVPGSKIVNPVTGEYQSKKDAVTGALDAAKRLNEDKASKSLTPFQKMQLGDKAPKSPYGYDASYEDFIKAAAYGDDAKGYNAMLDAMGNYSGDIKDKTLDLMGKELGFTNVGKNQYRFPYRLYTEGQKTGWLQGTTDEQDKALSVENFVGNVAFNDRMRKYGYSVDQMSDQELQDRAIQAKWMSGYYDSMLDQPQTVPDAVLDEKLVEIADRYDEVNGAGAWFEKLKQTLDGTWMGEEIKDKRTITDMMQTTDPETLKSIFSDEDVKALQRDTYFSDERNWIDKTGNIIDDAHKYQALADYYNGVYEKNQQELERRKGYDDLMASVEVPEDYVHDPSTDVYQEINPFASVDELDKIQSFINGGAMYQQKWYEYEEGNNPAWMTERYIAEDLRHTLLMKDDEKRTLNYLMDSGNREGAAAFLDGLQSTLDQRYTNYQSQLLAHQADYAPVSSSAASVGSNVIGGVVGSAGAFYDFAKKLITGEEAKNNNWSQEMTRYTQNIRNRVASNIHWEWLEGLLGDKEFLGRVYQAVMSGIDSTVSTFVGGRTKWGSLLIMAMESLASSYVNNLDSGMDTETSFLNASANAGLEVATEVFSVENILRDPQTYARAVARFLQMTGCEMTEESVGAILSPWINELSGGENEYKTLSEYLLATGQADTFKQAWEEGLKQYGFDIVDSGVMAIFSSAGTVISNDAVKTVRNHRTGSSVMRNSDALLDNETGATEKETTPAEKKAAETVDELWNEQNPMDTVDEADQTKTEAAPEETAPEAEAKPEAEIDREAGLEREGERKLTAEEQIQAEYEQAEAAAQQKRDEALAKAKEEHDAAVNSIQGEAETQTEETAWDKAAEDFANGTEETEAPAAETEQTESTGKETPAEAKPAPQSEVDREAGLERASERKGVTEEAKKEPEETQNARKKNTENEREMKKEKPQRKNTRDRRVAVAEKLTEIADGMKDMDERTKAIVNAVIKQTSAGKGVSTAQIGAIYSGIYAASASRVGEARTTMMNAVRGGFSEFIAGEMQEAVNAGNSRLDDKQIRMMSSQIADAIINGNFDSMTADVRQMVTMSKSTMDMIKDLMVNPETDNAVTSAVKNMNIMQKAGAYTEGRVHDALNAYNTAQDAFRKIAELTKGQTKESVQEQNADEVRNSAEVAASEATQNAPDEEKLKSATGEKVEGARGAVAEGENVEILAITDDGKVSVRGKSGTRSVEIDEVVSGNEGTRTLINFFSGNTQMGTKVANTMLQAYNGTTAADAVDFINDAMGLYAKAYTHEAMPTSGLTIDRRTAQTIYNQAVAEEAETEKKRMENAANSRITRGTGAITYNENIDQSKLTQEQKDAVNDIQTLAKGLGVDIEFYDGKNQALGDYNGRTGAIRLDINAADNGRTTSAVTLGHELTHYIEHNSPGQYAQLRNIVFGELRKAGVNTDALVQKYLFDEGYGVRSYDGAVAEVVAYGCEYMLADSNVISDMENKNPELYKSSKGVVNKVVGKIRKLFGDVSYIRNRSEGNTAAKALYGAGKYADKVAKAWDLALEEAQGNVKMATHEQGIVPQDAHTGSMTPESGDIMFSIRQNGNITERTNKYYEAHKGQLPNISPEMMKEANEIISNMADYMEPYLDIKNNKGSRYLPEEILGKTTFQNGSYGKTIENTTICFRTLSYIDFTNEIKKKIGRPLTVEESFLASQMLYDIAKEPQCLYCYVSLDRKAYDGFLLEYTKQRDEVIDKYNALEDKSKANIDKLYEEFLNKRKDTKNMRARFDLWIETAKNGNRLITNEDLTTEEIRTELKNGTDKSVARQIVDAEKYAQSASWAKKLEQYRSYNGDILSMSQNIVNRLNKSYGLRFYSFSEYTPAFIVENMQQIRDASVKGLYGLAYTKKPDFARIFANTGMNINISCFGRMDNGQVVADTNQGADWNEVKELRKQYKNVGAVFVTTNDEMTEWALAQDWIDVVIPFHIVRTGANVAEFYNWINNTAEQADKDAAGKNMTLSPAEFHNDRETFMKLVKERGLTPRFARWLDNPNYMKLVNETRLADTESIKLQPVFNLEAAKDSFDTFVEDGGYYGNWYKENVDYDDAIDVVAGDVLAGKRANEVEYGRQDMDFNEAMRRAEKFRRMRKNRTHGQSTDVQHAIRNIPHDISIINENKRMVTTMSPVIELNGNEFAMGDSTKQDFIDFFNAMGGSVYTDEYGKVDLNRAGVRDDIGHGFGPMKAAVIPSIPEVIKHGKMIQYNENWKGRGYDTIVVAAPVSILQGKLKGDYYVGVILNSYPDDRRRFYTHEATSIKKGSNVVQTGTVRKNGTPSNVENLTLTMILEELNNVNPPKSVRNQDYMDAVNNGDMATAQRLVNEAAKEAGFATDGNGKLLKLYHGTKKYGFTAFRPGFIFTTTSESAGRGYANFGRTRGTNTQYVKDDGTDATIIKNAKNVLGKNIEPLSDERATEIHDRIMQEFNEVNDKISSLNDSFDDWSAVTDFFEKHPEIENEFYNVTGALSTIIDSEDSITDENREDYGIDSKKLYDDLHKLKDFYNEHTEEVKNSALGKYFRYLNGYELGDAIIDIGVYEKLLKRDGMFVNSGTNDTNIFARENIQESIEYAKNEGVYEGYANLGDNPLTVDAEGSYWTSIKAPMIGDGHYLTDDIAEWAKNNGYTSVIIKNLLDPGLVNAYGDDYILFESSQFKSDEPVTYDDNGEVIPLSERFNTEEQDIRYARRQEVPGQMSMFDEAETQEDDTPKVKTKYRLTAEDRDYMAAVESGDMEEAQRLVNRKMWMKGFRVEGKMRFINGTYIKYSRLGKVWTNTNAANAHDRMGSWAANVVAKDTYDLPREDGTILKYDLNGSDSRKIDITDLSAYPEFSGIKKFAKEEGKLVTERVPGASNYYTFRNGATVSYTDIDTIADYLYTENRGLKMIEFRNVRDNNGVYIETDKPHMFHGDILYETKEGRVKLPDAVTYDDDGNVIPLSKRFNIDNPDVRYARRNGGSTAEQEDYIQSMRDYVGYMDESLLKTDMEKKALAAYKKVFDQMKSAEAELNTAQTELQEMNEYIGSRKPTNSEIEQRSRLGVTIDNLQKKLQRLSREARKYESEGGIAEVMYRYRKVLEENATKNDEELANTIRNLGVQIDTASGRMKEAADRAENLANKVDIALLRSHFTKSGLRDAASGLVKAFGSTMSVTEVENRLAPIMIEISSVYSGKANAEEVMERIEDQMVSLAHELNTTRKGNVYRSDYLDMLKGSVFYLNSHQIQEIKGRNSSLAELNRRMKGYVRFKAQKTGFETSLDQNWVGMTTPGENGFRSDYIPALDSTASDVDMPFELADFVESEIRAQEETVEPIPDDYVKMEVFDTASKHAKTAIIDNGGNNSLRGAVNTLRDYVAKVADAEKKSAIDAHESAKIIEEMRKSVSKSLSGLMGKDSMIEKLRENADELSNYYEAMSAVATQQRIKDELEKQRTILKSDAMDAVRKERTKWQERQKNRFEMQVKRGEVQKTQKHIERVIKRVNKYLTVETDTDNVPEDLKGIASLLVNEFVQHDKNGRFLAFNKETANKLTMLYQNMLNQNDYFPEELLESMDYIRMGIARLDMLGTARTLEDLNNKAVVMGIIDEGVNDIVTVIERSRQAFVDGKLIELTDAVDKVSQGFGDKKYKEFSKSISGLDSALRYGNMTPEYFFRMLENPGLDDLSDGLKEGEQNYGLQLAHFKNSLKKIAENYNYNTWGKQNGETIKVKTSFGDELELTTEQALSIYATWKREQSITAMTGVPSMHLEKGGIVYDKASDQTKGLKRSTQERSAHKLKSEDCAKIAKQLTEEQRNYADAMVTLLSTEVGEIGNGASMNMYGIKKYKERYYFPMSTWSGVKNLSSNTRSVSATDDARLAHKSFTNRLTANASSALKIDDFTDVVVGHVNQMLTYANFVCPIETMKRVLNYKVSSYAEDASGEIYETAKRSVRAMMEEAYGTNAVNYLLQYLTDLNGGVKEDKRGTEMKERMLSMFKKNAVAGSLSVTLQQPLSYIRAAMMINPKYLAEAVNPAYWKGSYREMMENSGVAVIKEMGRFDMGYGAGAVEWLTPDTNMPNTIGSHVELISDLVSKPPELMDRATWTRIWTACKLEQHELHPELKTDSEEFLAYVTDRFNDVIRRTQVYDSALVRSSNMRAKTFASRALTAFMAEPTLTANMLYDAWRNRKKSGGKEYLAKAGAVYILSAFMQAVIKGILGAGRTPDKKMNEEENMANKFVYNFISEANPLNLIPGYGDLVDVLSGNDITDDSWSALKNIPQIIEKGVKALTGQSEQGAYRDFEDTIGQALQLMSGVPVKNLMRDFRASYSLLTGEPYAKRETSNAVIKWKGVESLMTQDIIGMLNKWMGEAGFKTSNADYYERIYGAMKSGDTQREKELKEYMLTYKLSGNKNPEKTLQSGIATAAGNDSSADSADTLDFMIDNGLLSGNDKIGESFRKGEITESEAMDMYLKQNPDKTKDDAYWYIDRQKQTLKTGDSAHYSEYHVLDDAVLGNGNSSDVKAAVKTMTDHGYTQEQIAKQITGRYKEKLLSLKGQEQVHMRNMIEYAYKACGVTDGAERVTKWFKSK